ncbi:MAG: transposase, partial [Nitriliruptoraceae bacterium]
EQLFRALKGVDLAARPIHHRKADRTTAHLFICLLAYYVRWHLERAWATLTYRDHDPLDESERDPVAPARRSDAADRKAASHTTDSGELAHSFKTLLESLGAIVRNTHQHPETGITFTLDTVPTPHQQHALELVETINP